METRMKVALSSGIAAVVLVLAALAIAPVGATRDYGWHNNDDTFTAKSKIITETHNANSATVTNSASQTAVTGDVKVMHNDDLSGLGTGAAANSAVGTTMVAQANTAVATAPEMPAVPAVSMEDFDKVSLDSFAMTKLSNSSTAVVTNSASQTAASGGVTVTCNDDVTGGVGTGAASNSLSFTNTVTQTN